MKRGILLVSAVLVTVGCSGSDGADGGVLSDAGTVTLQNVQSGIFTPTCAVDGCHVGSGAPFGLDLSRGEALGNIRGVASSEVPGFSRVEPSSAAKSYLFMKVTGDDRILGDPMPPPPSGGSLSDSHLALLREWIEQGANP